MKTFEQQLSQYAAYHRDPRNIATHFIGVPMIALAVMILLSRPVINVAGIPVTPALVATLLTCAYYLMLHRATGLLMTAILLAMLPLAASLAHPAVDGSMPGWLGWGLGLFFVGWVIQFIGHFFEGRKPAFVDDVLGLIIAPLFMVCEVLFALGLLPQTKAAIQRACGPIARQTGRKLAA